MTHGARLCEVRRMSYRTEVLNGAAASVLCAKDALNRANDELQHGAGPFEPPPNIMTDGELGTMLTNLRGQLSILHTRLSERLQWERG